ncbi:MAG TPA: hypothetical protein VGM41_17735 [Chitinophagaceae bacterium]
MQFKKTTISWLIFILPLFTTAQSTALPQGYKQSHLLDRLEILLQDNPDLNFSAQRPFTRKMAVKAAELADSLDKTHPYDDFYHLSEVDKHNIQDLLMNNSEWVSGDKSSFASKKPLWNTFYTSKADFLQVNEKDFFFSVNPVIQQQQSIEAGNNERLFLNSKGLTARGLIDGKVGFDFYLTDNQERAPLFVQNRVNEFQAVPGAGYFKAFKRTAYDYFDGRGSVYFNSGKHISFQFGYDKNFIGDGYRSLFLSDFSNSYLFLKIDTRIWKLKYENIFMELTNQYNRTGADFLLPKKYASLHHLSINATPWLNIGLFESVVFGRRDHYDFTYLNPVIFLRSAEIQNGSPDKASVGLDFKTNIGHRAQIYGQLLINEFVLSEIAHYSNGWWGNKQGLQLGAKFINVFNIHNLDLQTEMNLVRPFTYAHSDSVSNYTNYNQPLAHPLGANFDEFIAIANYQPTHQLQFQGKIIYYRQGLDSAGENFGSNIFLDYDTRPRDYGFKIGSGMPANCINVSGTASYELKENLFIDASLMYRNYSVSGNPTLSNHTTMFTVGVRLNAFRREYDY